MFKLILESTEGLEIWAIVTMILFLVVFGLIVYYSFKVEKKHLNYMSNLPLEKEENQINQGDLNG